MIISGVKIIKIKKIFNKGGKIFKFVTKKDKYFEGFGEVYFNFINKNAFKGWIYHKKNQCILTVVSGYVKFNLIAKIRGKKIKKTFSINSKDQKILIIPKNIWFSFVGLQKSIVANLIKYPHNDKEVIKKIKL